MKQNALSNLWRGIRVGFLFGGLCVLGCSSTPMNPKQPLPQVPEYVKVPHPNGYNTSDVRGLFNSTKAPGMDTLKDCDAEFKLLRTKTKAPEEIRQGSIELVNEDPKKYHWCFYYQIVELQNYLSEDKFLVERQAYVLNTYLFLVPIARAFRSEYSDPRYLRAAIRQYARVSHWVFYRKLEISPEMTRTLVSTINNPFSMERKSIERLPILEKYGLRDREAAAAIADVPKADLDQDEKKGGLPEIPPKEEEQREPASLDIPAEESLDKAANATNTAPENLSDEIPEDLLENLDEDLPPIEEPGT